jgi:hypothetical protein
MSTPILNIPQIAPTQADKTTTLNDMMLAIEGATQDQLSVSLTGDVTLTTYQFTRYVCFVVAPTSAHSLIIPSSKRVFVVRNNGSADCTVGYTAGTGITVAAGNGAIIQSDGSNISLLGAGGVGPAGPTGPAGPIGTLVAGAGMTFGTLTADGTLTAQWAAGGVTTVAGGLTINSGTLSAPVYTPGSGISISGGVITGQWQGGSVTALGTGLVLSSGTLSPAGFGGTVLNVVAGPGLSGGTITTSGTLAADWNGGTVSVIGSGLALSGGTLAAAAIANNDLLANTAGSSAVPVATTLTGFLDAAAGNAQGDLLYRSGSAWTVLPPGTAGQVLQSGGASANPSWTTAASGSVTSVGSGSGLTGGPITSSGSLSLAAIADGRVLANTSGGSAVPVATTPSTVLDVIGSTQGDILYRSATGWAVLAPGTSGQVLQTGGASANPSWTSAAGGSVTSVASGTGLTGGPITSSGTLALAAIANHDVLANTSGGSAAPSATTVTALLDDTMGSTRGQILFRGSSTWGVLGAGTAGQLLKTTGTSGDPAWISQPYIVGAFLPGVMSNSQVCLVHTFAEAVTFPANFGTAGSGAASYGTALANATGSTTLTIAKCPAASDPTSGGNFSSVGSAVFASSGHAATLTTSGGATVSFAAGDTMKVTGPATADATLANISLVLAGDR